MTGNFCENANVKGILFSDPETHVKVRRITFFVIVQRPTYDLLHVLHCNLYISLEFVLFCGDLSHT